MNLPGTFIQSTREALRLVFWRKRTLSEFLRAQGISSGYLASLNSEEMTKARFLSDLFFDLEHKLGLPKRDAIVLSMARELADMETFPDLQNWVDSEQKIAAAKRAVAELRRILEKVSPASAARAGCDSEMKCDQRDKRRKWNGELSSFEAELLELQKRAGEQRAGYDFELWFYRFAEVNDIDVRPGYKDQAGRQVDGAIFVHGDVYLVELKLRREQTGSEDIDTFLAKVNSKADNTMGIMISVNGYNQNAIRSASYAKTPVLLMDGSHFFNCIFRDKLSLLETIDRVRQHAAQTGCAYLPASEI